MTYPLFSLAACMEGHSQQQRSTGDPSRSEVSTIGPRVWVQADTGPVDMLESHAQAALGGSARSLPHLHRIQASFGTHDVSKVQAHTDSAARAANKHIGSKGLAHDGRIALGSDGLDLHTVAHEAAHVVQGEASVQLSGANKASSALEAHADAVAAQVVRGESAQSLLDAPPSGGGTANKPAVQLKGVVEFIADGDDAFVAAVRNNEFDNVALETPDALRVVQYVEHLLTKPVYADDKPTRVALHKLKTRASQELDITKNKTDLAVAADWKNKAATAPGDKLYIGAGKDVSALVDNSPNKATEQERILDVPPDQWTWFVNKAWMEGGMEKGATFELTTEITGEIKDLILAGGLSGTAFLTKVAATHAGKGPSILWQSDDERPTYFAEEIAMLLDDGWLLDDADPAAGRAQKFTKGP